MDDKVSLMSSALMSQFASMLDQFKVGFNNSSFSGNPEVPLSALRAKDSGFRMAERTRCLTDRAKPRVGSP